MTDQHPITPPPELVQQWINEEDGLTAGHIATRAARWGADQQFKLDTDQIGQAYQVGADQELEACCRWLSKYRPGLLAADLRYVRRPKPPSLKEQALKDLDDLEANLKDFGMGFVPITNLRKALEALPND